MRHLTTGLACLLLVCGSPPEARDKPAPEKRNPLSVHILDTTRGRPAAGVEVVLAQADGDGWKELARAKTDDDGRVSALWPADRTLTRGTYRVTFLTAPFFAARKTRTFYPRIEVVFAIDDPAEHYHVPLLLSPFGYSTYRGS